MISAIFWPLVIADSMRGYSSAILPALGSRS
jgi:hypothetical protein